MHWFYWSCSTKIEGTVRPVKGQCGDTWWLERERQKELGTRKAEKNVSISALALCKHGSAPSALAEGRPPVCIWRCVFIVSGSVRRDSDLKPTGLVVLKETIHQRSQWRRIPLNMYVCVHLFLHAGALFFYHLSTSRVNSLQRFLLAVDGLCACLRTAGTSGVMGVRFKRARRVWRLPKRGPIFAPNGRSSLPVAAKAGIQRPINGGRDKTAFRWRDVTSSLKVTTGSHGNHIQMRQLWRRRQIKHCRLSRQGGSCYFSSLATWTWLISTPHFLEPLRT